MKTLSRSGINCRALVVQRNGATQVHLVRADSTDGALVEIATVRLTDKSVPFGEVLVKPYGDLPKQLIEAGVIHASTAFERRGNVSLMHARLTAAALASMPNQEQQRHAA